ncbi:probable auxin efflux carrier component 1d isoform X2 [Phoenix dactylifera]|uniref:Auxin efflux carrier component n=1 Tax=Phoenix dactylifera TaxID=42345 RepID=A0A8B8J3Z9_PHODC|nr:probable auxin efflux carrier component 1d isoform X2 [Phoenix dactylifera]
MIATSSLDRVVEAMAPLYAAMTLGYAAARWWHALTPDQCAGINRFVSVFAIPLLTFQLLSSNDPYAMNPRFLAADSFQKLLLLTILFIWARLRRRPASGGSSSSLPWVITIFSLATLPNTVIMGIPLLRGMYGPQTDSLMVQIVVLQAAVWYNLVIFLYEYMAARCAATEGCQTNASVPTTLPVSEKEAAIAAANGSVEGGEGETKPPPSPPSMWRILTVAGRKLCRIPNTHASFLGLIWSFIAFGFGIRMPKIIHDSVTILSSTAIGLSMFSIGTFMARQTRFISCGYSVAAFAMVVKFLVGPSIMIATSLSVGLQGLLLRVAIIQAALPLAVLSFVYAKEYNVHPEVMSTAVILGILSSVPITILYYMILGLWK